MNPNVNMNWESVIPNVTAPMPAPVPAGAPRPTFATPMVSTSAPGISGNLPSDVTGAGFVLSGTTMRRRLILASFALEKAGKTHLALTAPDPIAFINLDQGLEGVIEKFPGKRIHMFPDPKDPDFVRNPQIALTIADHERRWDKLERAYLTAIKDSQIRTVVVDTGTAFWDSKRLHDFGKLSQVPAHRYTQTNAEFDALLRAAYNHECNVIFTHKMKKQYAPTGRKDTQGNDRESWNGQYEAAMYSQMKFATQVNVLQYWDAQKGGPCMYVENCRHNQLLAGTELSPMVFGGDARMVNFTTLAMLVFPNTKVEDWR